MDGVNSLQYYKLTCKCKCGGEFPAYSRSAEVGRCVSAGFHCTDATAIVIEAELVNMAQDREWAI